MSDDSAAGRPSGEDGEGRVPADQPTDPAADQEEVGGATDWDGLCFQLQVERRYHLIQRRFFDGWHRVDLMVSAVAGSAAAALYFGSGTGWAPVLATVAAIAAAMEIAFAPGRRAEEERTCYRQTGALLAALTREGPPRSDVTLREMQARKIEIDVDAPVPNAVMHAVAFEDTCRALERKNRHPPVGWWSKRLCRVFDLTPAE